MKLFQLLAGVLLIVAIASTGGCSQQRDYTTIHAGSEIQVVGDSIIVLKSSISSVKNDGTWDPSTYIILNREFDEIARAQIDGYIRATASDADDTWLVATPYAILSLSPAEPHVSVVRQLPRDEYVHCLFGDRTQHGAIVTFTGKGGAHFKSGTSPAQEIPANLDFRTPSLVQGVNGGRVISASQEGWLLIEGDQMSIAPEPVRLNTLTPAGIMDTGICVSIERDQSIWIWQPDTVPINVGKMPPSKGGWELWLFEVDDMVLILRVDGCLAWISPEHRKIISIQQLGGDGHRFDYIVFADYDTTSNTILVSEGRYLTRFEVPPQTPASPPE